MDLLWCSAVQFPKTHLRRPFRTKPRPCFAVVRSSLSLPFLERKTKYYRELEAAVDVVERACRLCVDDFLFVPVTVKLSFSTKIAATIEILVLFVQIYDGGFW